MSVIFAPALSTVKRTELTKTKQLGSGLNLALTGTFMASMKRLSNDQIRANYWDNRLKYYQKLLSAHNISFWPAKFAATALNLMAKNLTKATAAGADNAAEGSTGDGLDAFTSPSTSWSGISYDFFPHNLTSLNEMDFSADWWADDNVQWQTSFANLTEGQ